MATSASQFNAACGNHSAFHHTLQQSLILNGRLLPSVLQMDAARGDWEAAAQHCRAALATNADLLQARNLCAAVLRRAGKVAEAAGTAAEAARKDAEAEELVAGSRALDPLDWWSAHLAAGSGDGGGGGGDDDGEDGSADAGSRTGTSSATNALGCDTQTALDVALDFADAGGLVQQQFALLLCHAVPCPAERMPKCLQ